MTRFADGGEVGITLPGVSQDKPTEYLRSRNPDPVPDYYTYGMGPEHQFYKDNVVADQPTFAHVPTTPTGPTTQSAGGTGNSQAAAAIGGTLASAGSIADTLGYGGTLAKGASTVGNALTGNWAGAAKNGLGLYNSLVAPSLADYGSGAAVDAALTQAGITGDLAGVAGAEGATGAAGAGAGAGSSSLGASVLGSGAAMGGLGLGLVSLYANSLHKHGDELRNINAFQQAFPGTQKIVAGGRAPALERWMLPDGTVLNQQQMYDLAGTWYGASAAPDGNQAEWQQKFTDLMGNMQPAGLMEHADRYINTKLPEGWVYDSATNKIVKKAAGGGAIDSISRHVRGPGTGRSDSIPAQLSDGEYVLTAEDVSLLGDGSNEAGARRLDDFRQEIRMHKGGALARGKISPNALSPLQYMKGQK
jgi:hypothetical protein